MINRGRVKYIPKIMLIELEDIKREDDIKVDCEAFRRLVKYARLGRETRRFTDFGYDWSKKAHLPPIPDFLTDKREKIIPKKNKKMKSVNFFGDIRF